VDRHLEWDACLNARDLGGLGLRQGGRTRWGSVVRSDNPAYLTGTGWRALEAYGVRTVIALRTGGTTDDEPDPADVPAGVAVERVVVEDLSDAGFVESCVDTGRWRSPLYFSTMLEHWPERCARAVSAVARSRPGGVVISCGRGCDRTGLVAFLLLSLVGVAPDEIAADWALSVERLRPRDPDNEVALQALLAREGTTILASIEQTMHTIDVRERLVAAGLSADDVAAVEHRLGGGPARNHRPPDDPACHDGPRPDRG